MRYRTVVADPPWEYEAASIYSGEPAQTNGNRHARARAPATPMAYPMMRVDQIAALPVRMLAERDAHLYLWTTQRYLRDAYEVVDLWGFRFSSILVWVKRPRGFVGTFACSTEFILFARRGALAAQTKVGRNWWEWSRGKHSAKPEAFLDIVEQVSPGPYLELFARRNRLGWDTWGNEALEHVEMG